MSIADALNQIDRGYNYDGFEIRQAIANFEEQRCDSEEFPLVVHSSLDGAGVFVPYDSRLFRLKPTMMEEKDMV